jgi:hypothetical protein
MKTKYKVHRFDSDMETGQQNLEEFLNRLQGEVISVFPHVARTNLSQIYGLERKVNFLFIVEKV